MLQETYELRQRLRDNTAWFRKTMSAAGFHILPGDHPIIPVMIGDAAVASQMSDELLRRGIYVVGFSFPVVPKGQARIRTQMSSAHSRDDLERAAAAFTEVGRQLKIID